MNTGISAINNAVQESSAFVRPLFNEIGKVIIGQSYLVERLTIGLCWPIAYVLLICRPEP